MNMWDREYVNGFDAMNEWIKQFIDYPHGAFLQFVRDFMQSNKLVRGRMRFGGKVADLAAIRASLLAIAGRTDQIAPPAAVRAQIDALGTEDVSFRLAPGGHMGVFAGASAPRNVWQPVADWLAPRSVARPVQARAAARQGTRRAATRAPQHTRSAARH